MARFGTDVADWLTRAMRGPEGQEKMPRVKLAHAAGISPDTLYRMLRGEGDAVEEATLGKLAKALSVTAPVVTRNIVTDLPPVSSATELIREAQARLDRALDLLGPDAAPRAVLPQRIEQILVRAGEDPREVVRPALDAVVKRVVQVAKGAKPRDEPTPKTRRGKEA